MSIQTKATRRAAFILPRPCQVITYTAMLLAAALALLPYGRMNLYDASAAVESPATQRAMQTIDLLSQSTRGLGHPHHDAARDLLSAELRGMGMEVQTQEAVGEVGGKPAALVNVIGKLAGTNPTGNAVLIMAHYDSTKPSPGASDNGSGTAIVLEIARAAAADPRPSNDLIVLFTDGEEEGILGVPPFLEEHPWSKQVRVALNFDGISTGPVFLWQSGRQNGRLIDLYASNTPRPMGVSWVDAIARVLPLDTDFRPLQQAGVMGASFTTPYLPAEYHTPLDRLDLVNPASIRHGLEEGLALTRALLNSDLSAAGEPDQAYLTLWGGLFVHYPASAAAAMGVLAGLLALAVLIDSVWRKAVRLRGVGSAALFTTANLLFVLLLQVVIEVVIFASAPLLSSWIRIPGSLALLLVLLSVGYRRLQKRVTAEELLLGGQMVWAACAVWSAVSNPLFSPPLTLTLLASLIPRGISLLRLAPPVLRIGRILALALILLLGAPVVYLLYRITGLIFLPAAIGAAMFALLLALVQPLRMLAAREAHAD